MKMIIRALLLSLIITAGAASAETEKMKPLSLHECIKLGVANNLKLQNRKIDALIAREGVNGVMGIYDVYMMADAKRTDTDIPEPGSFLGGHKEFTDLSAGVNKMLGSGTRVSLSGQYGKYVIPGNEFIVIPPYSASVTLSVSQSLMKNAFGSLDRAKVEYAEYGEVIAKNFYKRDKDLLALKITEGFWNLNASRANYEASRQSLKLAEELLASNKKKEKDGLLEETDVIAAEASIAVRESELLVLKNNVETAADTLANIIQISPAEREKYSFANVSSNDVTVVIKKDEVKGKALYSSALTNRQDLVALKTAIDQSMKDVVIKKNMTRPDVTLMGSISQGDTDMSSDDAVKIGESAWMVGIKLDTSLSKKQEKSALRISELAAAKARNDYKDMQAAVNLECRSVERLLKTSIAQVETIRRAKDLRAKKLKLEQAKFDQGRIDTRWVIQSQDELLLAQMAYHIALAEYKKAEAAMLVVQGISLEGRSK